MTMCHFYWRLYTTSSCPVFLCCNTHITEDVVWWRCWVAFQGSVSSILHLPSQDLLIRNSSQWCIKLITYPLLLLSCSASSQCNFITAYFSERWEGEQGTLQNGESCERNSRVWVWATSNGMNSVCCAVFLTLVQRLVLKWWSNGAYDHRVKLFCVFF